VKRYKGNDHQLTSSELNTLFAKFSTDLNYVAPLYKSTVLPTDSIPQFTDMNIFNMLHNLSATNTGLDQLPAWFLQLGAHFFASPIAYIFNTSINKFFVPEQWKTALICPIAKLASPKLHSEYRPISITPVLSRLLEKSIVREYINI